MVKMFVKTTIDKEKMIMSFGKNLQYLRQLSKNMTQEALAEKLNVSRQTVSGLIKTKKFRN